MIAGKDIQMKKLLLYLLVATIASSSLLGCGAKQGEKKKEKSSVAVAEDEASDGLISLKKIGTIEDAESEITMSEQGLYIDDEDITILDKLGDDNLKKSYASVSNLYDGYWVVGNGSEDVNSFGLVNEDGRELIPCEAAWITALNGIKGRYLKIYYSTGVTQNEDEALFTQTDRTTALFGSVDNDNSTLYSGYAKIYDLEKETFVEGIEITVDSDLIFPCGDSIISSGAYDAILYDDTGAVIKEFEESVSPSLTDETNGYFIIDDQGTDKVYDDKGNLVIEETENEDCLRLCSSGSVTYIIVWSGGKCGLSDLDGNILIPVEYGLIGQCRDDIVSVRLENRKYQLIDIETGEQVGQPYADYEYVDFGYWRAQSGDKCIYVNKIGEFHELDDYTEEMNIRKGDGATGYQYYIWEDKEYSDSYANANSLTNGIVWVADEENNKGAMETLTGTLLLDLEYSRIQAVDNYIYAYKDGVYDVYEIIK